MGSEPPAQGVPEREGVQGAGQAPAEHQTRDDHRGGHHQEGAVRAGELPHLPAPEGVERGLVAQQDRARERGEPRGHGRTREGQGHGTRPAAGGSGQPVHRDHGHGRAQRGQPQLVRHTRQSEQRAACHHRERGTGREPQNSRIAERVAGGSLQQGTRHGQGRSGEHPGGGAPHAGLHHGAVERGHTRHSAGITAEDLRHHTPRAREVDRAGAARDREDHRHEEDDRHDEPGQDPAPRAPRRGDARGVGTGGVRGAGACEGGAGGHGG